MPSFPTSDLQRLADRILSGEVVFFVGAGFSIDSEGNTSPKLIRRLMIRFWAMTHVLAQRGSLEEAQLCRDLREGLLGTFQLKKDDEDPPPLTDYNLQLLAREYYPINDWVCNAFTVLLKRILPRKSRDKIVEEIHGEEERLDQDKVPPISVEHLRKVPDLGNNRGKMLFLDTMGFADESTMSGKPFHESPQEVASSYQEKLRHARYEVFARLAREGLCATILTTNYDLLIEGGFRLAGFRPRNAEGKAVSIHDPSRHIPVAQKYVSRIAAPREFFRHGVGHQSALIVKIHGCVESYRAYRDQGCCEGYLSSMVFTYREIQNWRQDSWSRDFMSTLLRTRTIVFCGYSGVDPVLHDTFRSVYEEMTDQDIDGFKSRDQGAKAKLKPSPGDASAFFLGTEGAKEFHGLEILRAASRVVGTDHPEVTDHPNYLQFHRSDASATFPSADDLLLWVFHCCYREIQLRALESDLLRAVTLTCGQPCAQAEIANAIRLFKSLTKKEKELSSKWDSSQRARTEMHRIVGWTRYFQCALLREFAMGEEVVRRRGPRIDPSHMRQSSWYYPAGERLDWTAWGVVVELAIRRMIAAYRGRPMGRIAEDPQVEPLGDSDKEQVTGVVFGGKGRKPFPMGLSIQLGGFERPGRGPKQLGFTSRMTRWHLPTSGYLWPQEDWASRAGCTPSARELWRWVSVSRPHTGNGRFRGYLGDEVNE